MIRSLRGNLWQERERDRERERERERERGRENRSLRAHSFRIRVFTGPQEDLTYQRLHFGAATEWARQHHRRADQHPCDKDRQTGRQTDRQTDRQRSKESKVA